MSPRRTEEGQGAREDGEDGDICLPRFRTMPSHVESKSRSIGHGPVLLSCLSHRAVPVSPLSTAGLLDGAVTAGSWGEFRRRRISPFHGRCLSCGSIES